MKKRALALLLVMVLAVGMMPYAQAGYSSDVFKSDSSRLTDAVNAISAQNSSIDLGTLQESINYFLYTSRYAAIGGSAFPYPNKNGTVKTVDDGVYSKTVSAAGCYAYSKFVSLVIYGTNGNRCTHAESAGAITGDGLKDFLQKNAQAGEHLRIDGTHSVTYISGTADGFYYMDYEGDTAPYIRARYATYSKFAKGCNDKRKSIWLYNANANTNTVTGGGDSPQPPPTAPEQPPLPTNLNISTDKSTYTLGESVVASMRSENADAICIEVFYNGERLFGEYVTDLSTYRFTPAAAGTYVFHFTADNGTGDSLQWASSNTVEVTVIDKKAAQYSVEVRYYIDEKLSATTTLLSQSDGICKFEANQQVNCGEPEVTKDHGVLTYLGMTGSDFHYQLSEIAQDTLVDVYFTTLTPDIPGGFANFVENSNYYDGMFWDADSDAWFADNMSKAVRLGLMKGTGDGTFSPGNNVTLAEAVALAARIHSIYHTGNGGFSSYDGGNWYDPYVDYAMENDMLRANYNYDDLATREQFTCIFAAALPDECLEAIASDPIFVDRNEIAYQDDVEKMCRAGIINGMRFDGALYFSPNSAITRAEAAAIVTRMADPNLREG